MKEITKEQVDLVTTAYDDISIIYQGTNISEEPFLKQYSKFVLDNIFREKHNILISLHNGSPLYDAIMLVCNVLSIISMSSLTPEDVASQLNKGDIVSYGDKQKRIEFVGKTDDTGNFNYEFKEKIGKFKIPLNGFSKVIPYYGKAKTLGSIGGGEQHSSLEFQKTVLKKNSEFITSYVDTSVVIVAEHAYFDDLLNNTIIRYNNVDYKITDLIGVSFFTEENETYYSGNSNCLEANIKITNTMSTARNLLLGREENVILGFCAFGIKGIKNTVGELDEALKRKKIAFSAISYTISEDIDGLFGLLTDGNLPSPKVYACTKDFLLSHYLGVDESKKVFKDFEDLCNRIIDKQVECRVVKSEFIWTELSKVYRALHELRLTAGEDEHTEKFIIESYGLLRLMLSAVVPLKEFEDKDKVEVEYITPKEKLKSLKEYNPISDSIAKYVNIIMPYIQRMYEQLYNTNPKADYLSKSIKRGNNTVVVVDKEYYKPIIEKYFSKRGLANAFSVYTVRKAKNKKCDELYVAGKQDGINILNWNSAEFLKYVLYDAEVKLFYCNLKEYQNKISLFNRYSYFDVDEDILPPANFEIEEGAEYVEDISNTNEEVEDVVTEIQKIENIEQNFLIHNAKLHSVNLAGESNSIQTEITRIAACESGESIYFTKYYKAFVLDIHEKRVREVEVKDLKKGDSLIFTVNNGETKDIAELILKRYAENSKNEVLIKAIKDVADWKSYLRSVKQEKNFTYSDMAKIFKEYDYSVVSQTIRTWLEQECHVVGPRSEEAYYAMARLFKLECRFEEYVDNPRRYMESTELVRNQRTEILNVIADVIVAKYTGNALNLDKSFDEKITEEITKLSVLKQISQIEDVEERLTIPNSKVNKPILI